MKQNFLKTTVACTALVISATTNAQMVGTDVFLKGKYVEVGIGHLGYYGSDAAAPAGFHTHCTMCHTSGILGFVADPGMDGWTVGTPPMMGDYFAPGTPAEGWGLETTSNRCEAVNLPPSPFTYWPYTAGGATGANVSYTTRGSQVIGTWQGSFDSIDITQITTLDTNQLYFTVKVILTNIAARPRTNIYYLRTLDPDNDVTWGSLGGGFPTYNKVEYQSTDTTIVSATGATGAGSYLALGTTDTAATAFVQAGGLYVPVSSSFAAYYNMTSTGIFAPGPATYADAGIGLVIKIPHLATVDSAGDSVYRTTATYALHPANQATINYFYAFSTAARDSAIAYLNSIPSSGSGGTLSIKNVNNEANIQVYPNPSRDMVNITNLTATDRISVYDLMGKDMAQNWQSKHEGTNAFHYNDLPAGAYVVIVFDALGNIKARVPIRKM